MSWEDIIKNDEAVLQLQSARRILAARLHLQTKQEYRQVIIDIMEQLGKSIEEIEDIPNKLRALRRQLEPQEGPTRDENWG
tara:strand:- start:156 stop:398 length:243 start_codon:yes stop_codon:yes gene_type:complete